MAGVELLKDHQSLYKKGGIAAGIENNRSHDKGWDAGASLILVQKM